LHYSAGFGLGALNDAEEDDVDVYDGHFDQGRTRLAYDASDREDNDKIMITGRSSIRTRNKPEMVSVPRRLPLFENNSDIYITKRAASSVQTFRDGTPVLSGFVLSDKPVAEDQWLVAQFFASGVYLHALPQVPASSYT